MKKQPGKILVSVLLLALLPALLTAHPHVLRKSSMQVGQDQEIALSHVTVPYNEARPAAMEVGTSWGVPAGKLITSVNLKSGDTKIPAGEYQIKVQKESADRYSLALAQGETVLNLESDFTEGLSNEEHLAVDLHMRGKGENLARYIDLRFGTFLVAGKIKVDRESTD